MFRGGQQSIGCGHLVLEVDLKLFHRGLLGSDGGEEVGELRLHVVLGGFDQPRRRVLQSAENVGGGLKKPSGSAAPQERVDPVGI